MAVKKLIEVALPLEAINAACSKEKYKRTGNPTTLHLWWARRPYAAARAVIWASLVDDPSSHPEQFPTESDQVKERMRLFGILEQLVVWENSTNPDIIKAARAEIQKSIGNQMPLLLDPFAGGGTIPLEAQRLGLDSVAQDLNPVAVIINKAMTEIPPQFVGNPAVNPEAQGKKSIDVWDGNQGLASDVKYYGKLLRDETQKEIGRLYPDVQLPLHLGGGKARTVAYIWARTVKCPNPACGCETPLVRSFDLSKKKGKECHVVPITDGDKLRFTVESGKASRKGTAGRQVKGGQCIKCGTHFTFEYLEQESKSSRIDSKLMAVVAEGNRERIYLSPTDEQIKVARCSRPDDVPSCELVGKSQVNVGNYGFHDTESLFSNRQLMLLTTVLKLIPSVCENVLDDALASGMEPDRAKAYSQAINVYLTLALDRLAMSDNTLARWNSTGQKIQHCFGRQAIPMVWDYAEANPFCSATGSIDAAVLYSYDCLPYLPIGSKGVAIQHDAQIDNDMRDIIVSTDPPYYNNIDYADLSDFFYPWMRAALKDTYPDIFSTVATPKSSELIASDYRQYGDRDARTHFEEGMHETFKLVNSYVVDDIPTTVYYAYKQSDTETKNNVEETASTGWETMLSAIIKSGFTITGTWPMNTEMGTRLIASNSNSLTTSIILVCRKRPSDAPMATRRDFINALKRELRPALDKLQTSNIAPVDLAQSAIGPGIGVYSRFSKVLEANGTEMTVRAALQIINQELDLYFSDQDSDLDRESRFCVDLYTSYAFNQIRFGDADNLARAKNTSTEGIAARGALSSSKGIVRLLGRDELKDTPDPNFCWLFTQQLTHAMETGGIEACTQMIKGIYDSRAENAKALAYRLFTIADKKGWAQEAFAYNSLVVAWPDIQDRAAQLQAQEPVQYTLDLNV